MAFPRLSRLELRVMEALWSLGASSGREVQESFPEPGRPAYTTVLTIISRLEAKKAVRRARKVGNAYIFEAVISRRATQSHMLDDVLRLFTGGMQPLIAQLIDSGRLTLEDVQEAEKRLLELREKGKTP